MIGEIIRDWRRTMKRRAAQAQLYRELEERYRMPGAAAIAIARKDKHRPGPLRLLLNIAGRVLRKKFLPFDSKNHYTASRRRDKDRPWARGG